MAQPFILYEKHRLPHNAGNFLKFGTLCLCPQEEADIKESSAD